MGSNSCWVSPTGQVLSEQPFFEDKPHGEGRAYYASGALYRIDRFEHGVRVGEQVAYYEDGQLKTVTHFVNGMLEGECRLYWPNGERKRVVHFCAGVRQGADTFWNEKGDMTAEYFYVDGEELAISR